MHVKSTMKKNKSNIKQRTLPFNQVTWGLDLTLDLQNIINEDSPDKWS